MPTKCTTSNTYKSHNTTLKYFGKNMPCSGSNVCQN